MTAYQVQRNITIKSTVKQMNELLRNYKTWQHWSPWLIMEPDATLIYSTQQGQVGASYAWSGVLVGAGSMELLEVQEKALRMQIHFVKPFKSTATVCFDLEQIDDGVKVTWSMSGKLPWFMFWMQRSMKAYIGMDYQRGLAMLKEYAETKSVSSYVIVEGIVPIKAQRYIGIPRSCSIEELPVKMQEDFHSLDAFCKKHDLNITSVPFSIYNRFDIPNQETEFISCIPVDEEIDIAEDWISGTLDTQNALKTIHKGDYRHLGNGWMTGMTLARAKKMKMKKRPMGYEFYLSDPSVAAKEALVTEIYMPLRH